MSAIHRSKEWARFSRRVRPTIEAQLPQACINGKGQCIVQPGSRWHLAHRYDAALYPEFAYEEWNVGPACPKHNQSDGGKQGAKKTNAIKARKQRSNDYFQY